MRPRALSRALAATVIVALAVLATPVATALAAGELDSSFGGDGKTQAGFAAGSGDIAEAVAVQADDKVIAAGWTNAGGDRDFALARFDADGGLDASFDADGKLVTDIGTDSDDAAMAIAVQPDGKIVVAGESNGDFALARYNANGSLDSGFSGDGKLTTDIGASSGDFATAAAIQADGKLLAAGHSDGDFALARYTAAGALDGSFDGDGKLTTDIGTSSTDEARAMALQPDGKIVLAGESDGDFALARYSASGPLDASFDTDGKLTTDIDSGSGDAANGVAVQADGKIVAAGNSSGGDSDFALARYTAAGALDTGFDTDGKKVTDFDPAGDDAATEVLVQANAKIVAVGYSGEDFALARHTSGGGLDSSFDGDGLLVSDFGSGSADSANAAALDGRGRILAAGSTAEDFALARYLAGPAAPQITATDPGSPSPDATPRVTGTASADAATVEVFTQADCAGTPTSGAKASFEGAGIEVAVGQNQTTQLSARATNAAGDTSACSNNLAYTHDDLGPAAPQITATDPDSPANENNPELKGTAAAGATVRLYQSPNCTGPIEAQGSAAEFASPGLTASVDDDSSSSFSASATDQADNTSGCSARFAYTEDSTAPSAPTITDTDPNSPANDNSPEVKGSAGPGSQVRLYQSSDCTGPIEAQGSAARFASPGLTASVPDNFSASFSATATDQAGNTSPCSAPFNYLEDSTASQTTVDPGPTATADNTPDSPSSPNEPAQPPPDGAAPDVDLGGKRVQEAGDPIKVEIGCDEACGATAAGTVTIRPSARSSKRAGRKRSEFKLKSVREAILAGRVATLKLKPSRRHAKKLKKAVALGARAEAVVKVSAVDAAGNPATEKWTVKLKR